MSNLLEPRLLNINEAAEMLHCSVAKVRQMVIENYTLAAIHVDRMGFRKPFEFRGLQVFVVDDLGAVSDQRRGSEPAGFLRFAFAEVVRVLSERAHSEANAVPLSELLPAPVVAETVTQRGDRLLDLLGDGRRGAVQRVYESELRLNPKADRSSIGKQIAKAKKRKTETKSGATMYGQLEQNGKRMG